MKIFHMNEKEYYEQKTINREVNFVFNPLTGNVTSAKTFTKEQVIELDKANQILGDL